MPFQSLATRKYLQRVVLLCDFLGIAFATCLAQGLRTGHVLDWFQLGLVSVLVSPAFVCMALWAVGSRKLLLDDLQTLPNTAAIVSRVTTGVVILIPLAMGVAFMARTMYSRLFFLYLGCILVIELTAIRVVLREIVLRFRSYFVRRTVIIGSGRIATELAMKITSHPELLRDLVAFVHPANRETPNFPQAHTSQSKSALSSVKVIDLLNENNVGEVILAGSESNSAHVHQLILQCRERKIDVSVVPHGYDLYSSQARILDLGGLPVVKVESRLPQPFDLFLKRLCDLLLVIPLLVLSLPVWIFLASGLRLRGRRALYAEVRCGRNGKNFGMFRFNIPRHASNLSKFDAFLDRLSLTELPQLWNVALGDMSLVGPRPEDPGRVQNYSDWQRQRLFVKPGITGLAQVQGLRDENSSDEKSRYDLQYIHNWSPLVDLSLILQTAWTLCSRIRNTSAPSTRDDSGNSDTKITLSANVVGGSGC